MTSSSSRVQSTTSSIAIPGSGPILSYTLSSFSSPSLQATKLAIIAHPLGRLGGSQNDHVVTSVARALANQGYVVCRYDARGAGSSGGSASWNGISETSDFAELVNSVLLPLIRSNASSIDLLLIGYSYGSLSPSFYTLPETYQHLPIKIRSILISYPLSVLPFLTMFNSSHFSSCLRSSIQTDRRRTLAIWGTRDQFTGVDKYRSWYQGFKEIDARANEGSVFEAFEVDGADHFWREGHSKSAMLEKIIEWVVEQDQGGTAGLRGPD